MKKLILHIGTHKTGTSSIQYFLTRNQEALEGKGITYFEPVSTGRASLHHNISLGLLQRALRRANINYEMPWLARNKYFNSVEDYFRDLRLHMELKSLEKALVSSEGFFGPAKAFCNGLFHNFPHVLSDDESQRIDRDVIEELHRCIGADFNVTIVVYLRRQDLHFNSFYNYYMRNFRFSTHKSPKEYLESNSHEYDYSRELGLWTDVFGRDSLRPFVLEKRYMPDGLIRHFVSHAMEANTSALDYEEYVLNEKKPWAVLKFIDAIASSWPKDRFGKENLQEFVNSGQVQSSAKAGDPSCLDPNVERDFLDSLSVSNRALGIEYFGQKGDPFEPYVRRSSGPAFSFGDWIDVGMQLALFYEVKLKELKERIRAAELLASGAERVPGLAAPLRHLRSHVLRLRDSGKPLQLLAFRILRSAFRILSSRSRSGKGQSH